MNAEERYKALTTGLGGRLRELAHRMLADADLLPGRKELKAIIAELVPDDHDDMSPVRDAIEKRLIELAHKGQDKSERFELRGVSDEWALELAGKLEARDRVVQSAPPEEVDLGAIAKNVADDDPTGARQVVADAFKTPEQRVAELETKRPGRA